MKPLYAALCVLACAVTGALPAGAQQKPLKADDAFRLSATRAADGTLALRWQIAPGTYLYRDSLKATLAGAAVPLATSPGEKKDDPNFGIVEVYHTSAQATAAVQPGAGGLQVSFQGCAEAGICYPLVTRQVQLATLRIETPPPASAFEAPAAAAPPVAPAQPADVASDAGADGAADEAGGLSGGSLGLLLLAFFGFGLLLAFTPCVFPMLPILSGILAGGGTRPTPARGFALSASYGLAMAVAYGVLGIAAGWSGANLQAALQTPWALGLMAAMFLALALSMFGLFEISMPAWLGTRLSRAGFAPKGGGSLLGAGALGFASALVVGPCVTPPLAAAMLYAAQTGDAARGGAALFMLGLGMAMPLVVAGTFGARILPRSGAWLVRIKQACGVLFLGVAVVLAGRVLPAPAGVALWGVLALGLGVFLGGFDRMARSSPPAARLGKAAGLATALYGAVLLVGAAGGAGDPLRPLGFLAALPGPSARVGDEVRVSSPAALDAAFAETRTSGRPVLVSFTAGWCTVCKSNEAVMAEPSVQLRLAQVPRIDADVTDYGAGERALMSRYSIVGPPTLFLLDASGREVPGSRLIGAITSADIDGLMAKAGL
ncbi:protein-disulfide reductase DsbD [Xanthobacter sp. DSM 24535]|uniref:protein-disulfide reductase DsbD n=1 Tax=Roseixanthobacter psychrophilus TaxID=3119917 RepID=UPI00372C9CCB